MNAVWRAKLSDLRDQLRNMFYGPQALAFVPAAALAGFWLGGEPLLLLMALGMPALVFLVGAPPEKTVQQATIAHMPDLTSVTETQKWAENALDSAREASLATACMLVEMDGLVEAQERQGPEVAEELRNLTLTRLRNTLRQNDRAARLSDSCFVVFLSPSLNLDLESLLQLASRLQRAVEEPVTLESSTGYLSASIGFCDSIRLPDAAPGAELLRATQVALAEAVQNGPSAIRSWSENMNAAHAAQRSLIAEVKVALANGQIRPWFQPQVCTSTGAISGVEALARWIHPERGLVAPGQFLRCLEESGQMAKLGEVVLQHSLSALHEWEEAGLHVPCVSVNFSTAELKDPSLVDRIQWELDRFGLTPDRLGVEILETVIASSPEGVVARNIAGLGKIGCHIDLDDFGTGHASITSLRRFPVNRIKIDRSFVTRVDRDEDQRRMLAAVLGMADRLGLATLAEGVETLGEHTLLAQLGCDHVQGYGVARAMPADQLVDWSLDHQAKLAKALRLGRSTG